VSSARPDKADILQRLLIGQLPVVDGRDVLR